MPPLQAHRAGQRLARDLTHPADLDIEGIERVEVRAAGGGRKQSGEIAILVGVADQAFAIGQGVLHGS